jgi:hypothetical protein
LTCLNKYRFHSTSICIWEYDSHCINSRVASPFMIIYLTLKVDSYLLNWYTCLRHALLHNINHRKSLAYLTLTRSSSGTQNLMLHINSFNYRLSVSTFPKTGHHPWCFDSLLESRKVTFWVLHVFHYHHSCILTHSYMKTLVLLFLPR